MADLTSIDLSTYVRIGRYDLPEPTRTASPTGSLLAQEVSAVTYDWDTDTLFVLGDGGTSIVQISKTGELIDSMTLALDPTKPQGTYFYDPEGLSYVGNGQFVMTEERFRQIDLFTYAPGTTLTGADAQVAKLGTTIGNIGLEGISYDPLTNGFILVKEQQPEGIFQTTIDFATGLASNGSPTTENSINLFDPTLIGLLDFADIYALSNLTSLTGDESSHLLVLSQESGKIVNVDRNGTVYSTLTIKADLTDTLAVADQSHEGITMDNNGIIYVVSENGGGDINRPQLWVYAPSAVPLENQAPTGIVLNNRITTIGTDADTANQIKVANIAVVDDNLGTNTLSLSGEDADVFEIVGDELYLKAGIALDSVTKTSFNVTVEVDDITVGTSPDATTTLTLAIAQPGTTTGIFISEVAPWASGNTGYAADWFEVTNRGTATVDISGWSIDDNSNSFDVAVALNGVTSIAPGQSVIFIEGTDATASAFVAAWFGDNVPSGFTIGTYSGAGVGLSTGGDAVNLFDGLGNLITGINFGPSTTYFSFDNSAGLSSTTLPTPTVSTLSAIGANGAFLATDGLEVGSPGTLGGGDGSALNQAPTAVLLTNQLTAITASTSTETAIKLATIAIVDDGLGTNILNLSGDDADFFTIIDSGLYLKAGTTLDDATKASYSVTLEVDDVTVGNTPDASTAFTLAIAKPSAAAAVFISEVSPWSSGNSPYAADWFEVTNAGTSAIDITGWSVDDNSNSFAAAIALTGITTIEAGQSVVFIEGDETQASAFVAAWFGDNVPSGFTIGTYSGAGVGLSTGGDSVNLFDALGNQITGISFGASTTFFSFDNAAGLGSATLPTPIVSNLSVVGVNEAFLSVDGTETGSPGVALAANSIQSAAVNGSAGLQSTLGASALNPNLAQPAYVASAALLSV